MKGILKIYHPEEELKYFIEKTYCKSFLVNQQHFLELELETNDDLDHVEDDSLQYKYPQIAFNIFDFPLKEACLEEQKVFIDPEYVEVNVFDDEEVSIEDSQLFFKTGEEGVLQVVWEGKIDDFYTHSEEKIPFKLKCHFKNDEIEVEE